MKRIVVSMLLLVGLAAVALAQWGPSGCPAPGSVDPIEWREAPGDEGRIYLFRNGRQVGGWDYDAEAWRDYDAVRDVWSAPIATPPIAPPARATRNFGVDASRLHSGARFQLNGHEASREAVFDAFADKIPEDSKKLRVTIIGEAEDRKRVLDAFQGVEPDLRDRVVIWSVPPDHWSLTDTETGKPVFRADDKPTLYVQAPDGKVLHRQFDFGGGEDFAAIRKAVKGYDSKRDPDLCRPIPLPGPLAPPIVPTNSMPWLGFVAVVLGYVFIRKRST